MQYIKQRRMKNALSIIWVWILLSAAWGTPGVSAQTAPTLDGLVDAIYYSHNGRSIEYKGFYPEANATLYVMDDVNVDSNYIWLAWIITKDFNDNSYGDKPCGFLSKG